MSSSQAPVQLSRQMNLSDAVVIGLGSMVGAGVFVAFGPATNAAGSGILVALVVAAIIAYCNAVASAQLAAQYPVSGGTYIYGRERLNHWAGFIAGWGFVIGKTASCTAMALTFGTYALPDSPFGQRALGIVAVAALAALNYRGVTRTVQMTRILITFTLTSLGILIVALLGSGGVDPGRLTEASSWENVSALGILQAAGFLFFAFAGYARIATMGEEVKDPSTTIPRAIPLALFLTMAIYAVVGVVILGTAGADAIGTSSTPLVTAANAADAGWIEPVLRLGAMVASLGALLGLMAGIGRTSLAMARHGDLPVALASVHSKYKVPHVAEVTLAVVVIAILLVADIREAIGFSSFGVLVYYAIANMSAWTQTGEYRRWPRWVFALGLVGCVSLVVTLPWQSVVLGLCVYAAGIVGRSISRSIARAT